MKCEATSDTTHDVLISKEIGYRSYKDICSGEKKKVNLGHYGNWWNFKVENNLMVHVGRRLNNYIYGKDSSIMAYDWEILWKFFSIHSIEPNWLDCNSITGWYDEDLGGWTGCVGKV